MTNIFSGLYKVICYYKKPLWIFNSEGNKQEMVLAALMCFPNSSFLSVKYLILDT